MEPQKIKAEIDAEKRELERLIDSGAEFNEIYERSVKLDKLIVTFYKRSLGLTNY